MKWTPSRTQKPNGDIPFFSTRPTRRLCAPDIPVKARSYQVLFTEIQVAVEWSGWGGWGVRAGPLNRGPERWAAPHFSPEWKFQIFAKIDNRFIFLFSCFYCSLRKVFFHLRKAAGVLMHALILSFDCDVTRRVTVCQAMVCNNKKNPWNYKKKKTWNFPAAIVPEINRKITSFTVFFHVN